MLPSPFASRWFRLLLFAALSAGASPLCAQVIEIGDDGSARTYSQPTRFVSTEQAPVDHVAQSVARENAPVDRIDNAARQEHIDVGLLRAVAWRESRFDNGAVSPKGAQGIMQLMPATAASLGVDPADPDANVHGGARYLAQQLRQFGSVPLALAAYNAGPGAVRRWGGIPPFAETRAYVSAIMTRWADLTGPLPRTLVRSAAITKLLPSPDHVLLLEVPAP